MGENEVNEVLFIMAHIEGRVNATVFQKVLNATVTGPRYEVHDGFAGGKIIRDT